MWQEYSLIYDIVLDVDFDEFLKNMQHMPIERGIESKNTECFNSELPYYCIYLGMRLYIYPLVIGILNPNQTKVLRNFRIT